jgi:iron complex transport system permease protein
MICGRIHIFLWVALLIAVMIIFALQLVVGSYPLSIADILHAVPGSASGTIFFQSRLPAAIAATIGGAALSLSGLQMQTYFKNPVAGPFVLGISSGASLGVAVLIMLSGTLGYDQSNEWALIIASSVGALGIFFVVMVLSYRLHSAVSMLIIGLMIASFVSAMVETIQTLATADSIRSYLFWTMGTYRNIALSQIPVLAIVVALAVILSIYLIKPLNLLLMGEEYARLTGLNIKRSRALIVISTCLLTGGVTAFCGPIGFVGLAVPHIARVLFKTSDHKALTPAVMLLGAVVSGTCNLLTGISIHGLVLPINTITSLLGAPFVIWIVYRSIALR